MRAFPVYHQVRFTDFVITRSTIFPLTNVVPVEMLLPVFVSLVEFIVTTLISRSPLCAWPLIDQNMLITPVNHVPRVPSVAS